MYNNNTNPAYIAADHHKMKLLDDSHLPLKVLKHTFFPHCIKKWNKL